MNPATHVALHPKGRKRTGKANATQSLRCRQATESLEEMLGSGAKEHEVVCSIFAAHCGGALMRRSNLVLTGSPGSKHGSGELSQGRRSYREPRFFVR